MTAKKLYRIFRLLSLAYLWRTPRRGRIGSYYSYQQRQEMLNRMQGR